MVSDLTLEKHICSAGMETVILLNLYFGGTYNSTYTVYKYDIKWSSNYMQKLHNIAAL